MQKPSFWQARYRREPAARAVRFAEKSGRGEDPALAGFHAAARERLALVWTLGAEPTGPPPITIASKRGSRMPGVA